MITPLLTQLTYEGLVDELIGIKNCEYFSLFGQNQLLLAVTSACGAPISLVDTADGNEC